MQREIAVERVSKRLREDPVEAAAEMLVDRLASKSHAEQELGAVLQKLSQLIGEYEVRQAGNQDPRLAGLMVELKRLQRPVYRQGLVRSIGP